MFDETPNSAAPATEIASVTEHSDAVYHTHVGKTFPRVGGDKEQVDVSQYRYQLICFNCLCCKSATLRIEHEDTKWVHS